MQGTEEAELFPSLPFPFAFLQPAGGDGFWALEAAEPRGTGNVPGPERVWPPASPGTAEADRRL